MALTAAEEKYFDETVDRIESSFKVGIPIEVPDHGLLMQPVCIAVDKFFVHECYKKIDLHMTVWYALCVQKG